ncbi:MAG: hypothetical protein RhofKO_41710 [Rhodothermales bacterium]
MSDVAISLKEQQIEAALAALPYGLIGEVAMLVGKPAPGEHIALPKVEVVKGFGFKGDHRLKSHWRGARVPGREVSAVSFEVAHVLGVDPLTIGDNLVTRGLDLKLLRTGDRVQIGTTILERSDRPHRPCHLFSQRTSPEAYAVVRRTNHRGALFIVVEPGTIAVGDAIVPLRQAQYG